MDVSPDALVVARRNAVRHGVADRIAFLQGDLFAPLAAGITFDLIVSNPPYIAPDEFPALAPDVRDHEPRIALDGGSDGLAFYRRIAAGVGPFLKPGGRLLVEIGYTQEEAVRAILERAAGTGSRPDDQGHERPPARGGGEAESHFCRINFPRRVIRRR